MKIYTITLERISTGETSPSMLFRGDSEEAARAYAEGAIAGYDTQRYSEFPEQNEKQSDLRIHSVAARDCRG